MNVKMCVRTKVIEYTPSGLECSQVCVKELVNPGVLLTRPEVRCAIYASQYQYQYGYRAAVTRAGAVALCVLYHPYLSVFVCFYFILPSYFLSKHFLPESEARHAGDEV